MLAMPPQMNTCELCQVPGCSNRLYILFHSCVPMSPAVSPPSPLYSCPGVQQAAQPTHLQQSLTSRGKSRSNGELVLFKSNLQLLAISYRLSKLYCTPTGGQRSFCGWELGCSKLMSCFSSWELASNPRGRTGKLQTQETITQHN